MSRTVSARIPKEVHEELRERCNNLGCSINDYLAESIKFTLYGSSDFNFEDEQEEKEELESKEIPKGTVTRVIDDNGNVVLDNSKKKPQVVIID